MIRPFTEIEQRYEIEWTRELGHGHYSQVFPGFKKLRNGRAMRVAAKRIPRNRTKNEILQREITALAKLKHTNIMRLYDVYYDDNIVVLVLEYLGGGELFKRIAENGPYKEHEARRHAHGLLDAIRTMHAHGIIHRDLKPENLVLAESRLESTVKISDFGLSRIVLREDENRTMMTVCGTQSYAAPEVNLSRFNKEKRAAYSSKCDIWSMGVILYVMLAGYHPMDPYGSVTDDEITDRARKGIYDFDDPAWEIISYEAKDLVRSMMQVVPERRFDAAQCLAHAWFDAEARVEQGVRENMRRMVDSIY